MRANLASLIAARITPKKVLPTPGKAPLVFHVRTVVPGAPIAVEVLLEDPLVRTCGR